MIVKTWHRRTFRFFPVLYLRRVKLLNPIIRSQDIAKYFIFIGFVLVCAIHKNRTNWTHTLSRMYLVLSTNYSGI